MTSSQLWPCAAVQRANLSARCTLRVGGQAEWLLEPADPEQLREAWCAAVEYGGPRRLLGGGANLIVGDGLLPGVTICTERLRRVWRYVPPELRALGMESDTEDPFVEVAPRMAFPEVEEAPKLIAWAGTSMPGLVARAKDLGWSGLEGLAGVPGHLGGGVAMNAGGSWGELWDVVERVRVIDEQGQFRDLARAECSPTYRNGNLGERIVVAAILALEVSHKSRVEEEVRRYLKHKREVQPVTESSAGCVFKNPDRELSEGLGAGQLVEVCGLKGRAVGGAQVSELHGNFVVNTGGASAADVMELIELVQAEVFEQRGVTLEREVKFWETEG
jgi:UDP-N-acetylmuramate dehydrogenase